jgi:tricarballylate dehydrogenase
VEIVFVDTLVIGAGNAGLCAAISSAQAGQSVAVIEKADSKHRGGNSSLTMNFRFPHETFDFLMSLVDAKDLSEDKMAIAQQQYRPYTEADMLRELRECGGESVKVELLSVIARSAKQTIEWLRSLGHKWEFKPHQYMQQSSLPIRLLGSGEALQRRNFEIAATLGVKIHYEHSLCELLVNSRGVVIGATVTSPDGTKSFHSKRTILACGGFQGNQNLRVQHLGRDWLNIDLRGVPFNTGDGLIAATKIGANTRGAFGKCHATPQSMSITPFVMPGENERSQRSSRYQFNLGITVSSDGRRFCDEGENYSNFVYAQLGGKIVQNANNRACQIFDSTTIRYLQRNYFDPQCLFRAATLEHLGNAMQLNTNNFLREVRLYNDSAATGKPDFSKLDGLATSDLHPCKSNWASPIVCAPFYAAPVKAGLTFTYGGLDIDQHARVLGDDGKPIRNLYACGEIIGGIFGNVYPGGAGLMSGACFGRIAGSHRDEAQPA